MVQDRLTHVIKTRVTSIGESSPFILFKCNETRAKKARKAGERKATKFKRSTSHEKPTQDHAKTQEKKAKAQEGVTEQGSAKSCRGARSSETPGEKAGLHRPVIMQVAFLLEAKGLTLLCWFRQERVSFESRRIDMQTSERPTALARERAVSPC